LGTPSFEVSIAAANIRKVAPPTVNVSIGAGVCSTALNEVFPAAVSCWIVCAGAGEKLEAPTAKPAAPTSPKAPKGTV
jgi:hypothetical protein